VSWTEKKQDQDIMRTRGSGKRVGKVKEVKMVREK
jgi:hypothetical protein